MELLRWSENWAGNYATEHAISVGVVWRRTLKELAN